MAAPTHPAKIPKEEWDRHKDAIMALYLGNSEQPEDLHGNAERTPSQSLSNVVVTMKEKYGFVISSAQLERQLNKWQFRKNFKPDEWEQILDQLDRFPPNTDYRVNISGCIKYKNSIKRAERYAKRRRAAGSSSRRGAKAVSALPYVRVEVRGERGKWTPARDATPAVNQEALTQSVANQFETVPPNRVATYATGPAIGEAALLELQSFLPVDNLDASVLNPNIPDLGNLRPEFVDYNVITSDTNPGTLDAQAQRPAEYCQCLPSRWLNNLPSRSLTNAAALIEDKLKGKIVHGRVSRESLSHDLQQHINISGSYALQSGNSINPVRWLEILGSLSSSYSHHERTKWGQQQMAIRGQQQMTIRGPQIINLSQFLSSALSRAFSDAIHIPNGMLAKVMIPNDTLFSYVCRYLKDPRAQIETMLAPYVFPSAIWECQSIVVAAMLERGVIDPNRPLCIPISGRFSSYGERGFETGKFEIGGKCMPIEAATMNGDIETIEILLLHGAEVTTDVLLCAFIDYIERIESEDTNLPSKSDIIWNTLIEAGAMVDAKFLTSLIDGRNAQTPFIQFIVAAFRPSARYMLFCKELEDIASEMGIKYHDDDLSNCKKRFKNKCNEEIKGISDLLLKLVLLGHIDMFEVVFPYYRHTIHTEFLCAIIKSGSKRLIDIVMRQKPNIHPAYLKFRSPFMGAIETQNKEIIDFFITSGIIDVLEGNELKDTVTKAAQYKDAELMQRLRSRYPNAEDCEVSDTMSYYPEGVYRDSLRSVIADAGVCVSRRYCRKLGEASDRRHDSCVRFYLASDFYASRRLFWDIIAWGDQTIIQDLLSNYYCDFRFDQLPTKIYCSRHESPRTKWRFEGPGDWYRRRVVNPYGRDSPPMSYRVEIHPLKTLWDLLGDKSKVDLICESRLATAEILVAALLVAVIRQDQGMVSSFIQAGADASDERVWAAAVEHSPGMLPVLRQSSQMPKPVVTRGLRTRALKDAIEQGPASFEGVSYLIKSGSVDIFDTGDTHADRGPLQTPVTPLGTAISQYQQFPQFSRDVIVLLLDAGCDLNDIVYWNEEGSQTALLRAVEIGNKELVEFFLGRGAQLDGELSHLVRRTPLQKAVEMGDLEMVQLLISRGAKVNARPAVHKGGTAFQLAARSGNCLVATELFNQGALLYMRPSEFGGQWPIEAAAEYGHLDMIQLLWNAMSDIYLLQDMNKKPGFEEKQLRRAMELATKYGHIGCRGLIEELSGLEQKPPPVHTPIYVDWPPPGWSVD